MRRSVWKGSLPINARSSSPSAATKSCVRHSSVASPTPSSPESVAIFTNTRFVRDTLATKTFWPVTFIPPRLRSGLLGAQALDRLLLNAVRRHLHDFDLRAVGVFEPAAAVAVDSRLAGPWLARVDADFFKRGEGLVDVGDGQADVEDADHVGGGRGPMRAVGVELEDLVVVDAQIDEPGLAVVVLQARQLAKAELAVPGERRVEVANPQGDVA